MTLISRSLRPGRTTRPSAPSRGRTSWHLCQRLTEEFEEDFEQQWRTIGLSVDWDLTYATINERSRRVAQLAFLRNLARGEAYATEGPSMWDVDFQTAVAQAEFEDREVNGAFHKIALPRRRRRRSCRDRDHAA